MDSLARAGMEVDVVEQDAATWQDDVRARACAHLVQSVGQSSRPRRWAWGVAIVLHLLLVLGLRLATRTAARADADTLVMQVDLLDPPPAEPALPEPPAPRAPSAVRLPHSSSPVAHKSPLLTDAPVATDAPASPRLFQSDGTAMIPPAPEGFHAPANRLAYSWDAISRRNHNPLHCRRGDRDIAAFENVGDVIARNPILALLGLANPYRGQLVAQREAQAAASCDYQ